MRNIRHISSNRGFTAIEVSAVATIIAILALILIPIMRTRVEEARIAAATDDMVGLDKAASMAFAYTGKSFRTFDLLQPRPNLENLTVGSAAYNAELQKLPKAFWNRAVTAADEPNLVANWEGPYIAVQASMTLDEALNFFPHLFRSEDGSASGSGPIFSVDADDDDEQGNNARARRKVPIDPWGAPYLMFGVGPMGTAGNPADTRSAETNFSTAVVYSLGPNSLPGNDLDSSNSAKYFRPIVGGSGVLGQGDDLTREF